MSPAKLVSLAGMLVAIGGAVAGLANIIPVHSWIEVVIVAGGAALAAAGESILKAEGH